MIENIKADKLEGPKILGKIDLPVDNDTSAKGDSDEKRKRKRIPIEKKTGRQCTQPNVSDRHKDLDKDNSKAAVARPADLTTQTEVTGPQGGSSRKI